jgi:hypothetical protein
METSMLERVFQRFDLYLDHHPSSGVDWALKELLQLSIDYLPEFTSLDEFRDLIEAQPPTPNRHVNEALWYLLAESSLFSLACANVFNEPDELAAEAQTAVAEKAEVTAAAQEAVTDALAEPQDSSDLFFG